MGRVFTELPDENLIAVIATVVSLVVLLPLMVKWWPRTPLRRAGAPPPTVSAMTTVGPPPAKGRRPARAREPGPAAGQRPPPAAKRPETARVR